MSLLHKEFQAMVQGRYDYIIQAIPINTKDYGVTICLLAEEGAIYITKQQAMDFFGLVDSSTI